MIVLFTKIFVFKAEICTICTNEYNDTKHRKICCNPCGHLLCLECSIKLRATPAILTEAEKISTMYFTGKEREIAKRSAILTKVDFLAFKCPQCRVTNCSPILVRM